MKLCESLFLSAESIHLYFLLTLFLCSLSFSPLQKQIIVDPLNFSEERFRPSLEERLESIISGAALMADSSCTRDDRRERIVAECNSVRQALQDLLTEYMGNVGALYEYFCVGLHSMDTITNTIIATYCKMPCNMLMNC